MCIRDRDGSEIRVDTEADTDYAVENVYVNGEEMTSKSFIITEDTVDVYKRQADTRKYAKSTAAKASYSPNIRLMSKIKSLIPIW